MSQEKEYVLGTNYEELNRLGFQHQMWRAQAYAIWERAKFAPGMRLLDVGCGPGFATRDLSALVGSQGAVGAIDQSEKFVEHVKSLSLPNVEGKEGDVQQVDEHFA